MSEDTKQPMLMSASEAGLRLGMSASFVKKHSLGRMKPVIPSVVIGRRHKFTEAGLRLFIERNSSEVDSK
jgi:hypothetical protein